MVGEVEGEVGNSFKKVAAADQAFKEQATKTVIDPALEVDALAALFRPPLCTLCAATLGARWPGIVLKHEAVAKKSEEEVGNAICSVVEVLDAVHLLPSGIRARLEDGIRPACYGLATLIDNLFK